MGEFVKTHRIANHRIVYLDISVGFRGYTKRSRLITGKPVGICALDRQKARHLAPPRLSHCAPSMAYAMANGTDSTRRRDASTNKTETETRRQTNQIIEQTYRNIDRRKDSQIYRHTNKHTHRLTDRRAAWQTERHSLLLCCFV